MRKKNGSPSVMQRRIGSTTYQVTVRFSEQATETLHEKVARILVRETSRQMPQAPSAGKRAV